MNDMEAACQRFVSAFRDVCAEMVLLSEGGGADAVRAAFSAMPAELREELAGAVAGMAKGAAAVQRDGPVAFDRALRRLRDLR